MTFVTDFPVTRQMHMLPVRTGRSTRRPKANLRADGHEVRPDQPPFAATSEPAHRTLQVGGYLLEVLVRAVPHSLFDLPEAFLNSC